MNLPWFEGLEVLLEIKDDAAVNGQSGSIVVSPAVLNKVAMRMDKAGFFLEDVTAMDISEGFLISYHFDHYQKPGRVTARVLLSRQDPTIPTIADIYQGAEWHERECSDFFGITFSQNPNPAPLLLPVGVEVPPLIKEEKARKGFWEVITFGEVVYQSPDFPHRPEAEPQEQTRNGR